MKMPRNPRSRNSNNFVQLSNRALRIDLCVERDPFNELENNDPQNTLVRSPGLLNINNHF